jgi:cystathionine gamma-synthase
MDLTEGDIMAEAYRFETRAIHAGQAADPATGAVMVPIYLSSTFKQDSPGQPRGFEYSRTGNPTRQALESCLASLEGGEHGLAFASGMAATDAVLHLLQHGDHVLAAHDLYGGTHRILEHVFRQLGVDASYGDASDAEIFLAGIRPSTRLVWLETPTNPWLDLCDLEAICTGVREASSRAMVCVDSTFATPYLQRPLTLGADIVLHSTTKYLGGHSDVVGGALVVTDGELADDLRFLQNAVGAVPSPLDCFLVLRGIKTLAVRMDRHCSNAQHIAGFLQDHESVTDVRYPGLTGHPQHSLALRQMRLPGGMVSFRVNKGKSAAYRLASNTELFTLAESLGGVESLIEVPALMTHQSTAGSSLEIPSDLIRLSIGLEDVDDLTGDLEQALAKLV